MKKRLYLKNTPTLLILIALFSLGTLARAQSMPAQDNKPVQDEKSVRDNDTTRKELAQFDQFLDSHREISEQLRKDPSLVNNKEFVDKHPALQTYLREQPGVREEIRENPNAFMRQENNFDRHEDARDRDTNRAQVTSFRSFLGSHSDISERLSRDPSLVKNHEFVENHPELQAYLKSHPDVQDQLMKNPQNFVKTAQVSNSTTATTTTGTKTTNDKDNSTTTNSGQASKAPKVDAKPTQ